jgi:glycerol uptake facilitator protein
MVWLAYYPHWKETADPGLKLAVFCTAPAIRNLPMNLLTELFGTFVLVLGVLAILAPHNLVPQTGFNTGLGPLLVGVLVWSIGLCSVAPLVTRSIPPVISVLAWPTPFCRLPEKAIPTGRTEVANHGSYPGGILGALFYKLIQSRVIVSTLPLKLDSTPELSLKAIR